MGVAVETPAEGMSAPAGCTEAGPCEPTPSGRIDFGGGADPVHDTVRRSPLEPSWWSSMTVLRLTAGIVHLSILVLLGAPGALRRDLAPRPFHQHAPQARLPGHVGGPRRAVHDDGRARHARSGSKSPCCSGAARRLAIAIGDRDWIARASASIVGHRPMGWSTHDDGARDRHLAGASMQGVNVPRPGIVASGKCRRGDHRAAPARRGRGRAKADAIRAVPRRA
jgi:hypothetical protein